MATRRGGVTFFSRDVTSGRLCYNMDDSTLKYIWTGLIRLSRMEKEDMKLVG